jgi:Zn-finger nucleic acid-binding protein
MQCPQCSSSLASTLYEGVPIHTCATCGGEFIGGEELGRIVQTRQEQFSAELQDSMIGHEPSFGGTVTQPQRQLCCPACDGPMQVINYSGDSGIFVDRCAVCGGLWLDHEELEKVQFVMEKWADEAPAQLQAIAGELEMARRKAADAAGKSFSGSRFSFVNAIVNRLLDAA